MQWNIIPLLGDMKFAYKWLDLEMVIRNEVTQAQMISSAFSSCMCLLAFNIQIKVSTQYIQKLPKTNGYSFKMSHLLTYYFKKIIDYDKIDSTEFKNQTRFQSLFVKG